MVQHINKLSIGHAKLLSQKEQELNKALVVGHNFDRLVSSKATSATLAKLFQQTEPSAECLKFLIDHQCFLSLRRAVEKELSSDKGFMRDNVTFDAFNS